MHDIIVTVIPLLTEAKLESMIESKGWQFPERYFSTNQIQLIYTKGWCEILFCIFNLLYLIWKLTYILMNVYMTIFSCIFLYYVYGIMICFFLLCTVCNHRFLGSHCWNCGSCVGSIDEERCKYPWVS